MIEGLHLVVPAQLEVGLIQPKCYTHTKIEIGDAPAWR